MEIWIVAALVAGLVIIGVAAWLIIQQRRTERLTERYGPEYKRAVEEKGDRREAERELEDREKRVRKLDIRPLEPGERDRFAVEWRRVQARFVDDPSGAISAADTLVLQLMEVRGYPTVDFEQRMADVSVDHGAVVNEYRAAHEIAERQAAGSGGVGTEELRQAMVHYRALFDDLLEVAEPQAEEVAR